MRQQYPVAYQTYTSHCKTPPPKTTLKDHQRGLVGTCLLIPPSFDPPGSAPHHIACLFTSLDYGKRVDPPDAILINTTFALRDLESQITVLKGEKGWQGEVWAVRINSGKFGVPWEKSREVLERGGLDIAVVRPPEEVEKIASGGAVERSGEGNGDNAVGIRGGGGKRKAVAEVSNEQGDGRDEGEEERARVTANLRKRRQKRGMGGN